MLQRPWFDFYQQRDKMRSIISRTGGGPVKRGFTTHVDQANVSSQLVGQDLRLVKQPKTNDNNKDNENQPGHSNRGLLPSEEEFSC